MVWHVSVSLVLSLTVTVFESDHLLHYHHSEQIYGQLLEQSPASVKWRSAVLLAGKLQRSFHWLIYICHHSERVVYLSRADMSSLHFCLQFIISSYFLPEHFAWRIVNTAMLSVRRHLRSIFVGPNIKGDQCVVI